MAVLKYKDPETGEVRKVGFPAQDSYTKSESDTLYAQKTHASQHKTGGSDPLTAADVGAAPAEFGLGSVATQITDWNDAKKNGWYMGMEGTLNAPDNHTWFGLVSNWQQESVRVQKVWGLFDTELYCSCERLIYPDAGTPWEWVNPPMHLGVEYRTTERINGLVVYKRRNSSTNTIEYRLEDETEWKPYAQVVGAVSTAGGGKISGTLSFQQYDNGKGSVYKNHAADADGGFWIKDEAKDGSYLAIDLQASSQKAYLIKNGQYKELIHAGNVGDYAAPMYTYGTTDLTAGSSPLETGKVYFVYE